jgi:hypothetical protein
LGDHDILEFLKIQILVCNNLQVNQVLTKPFNPTISPGCCKNGDNHKKKFAMFVFLSIIIKIKILPAGEPL